MKQTISLIAFLFFAWSSPPASSQFLTAPFHLPFQAVFVPAGDSLIAHSFNQDSSNNSVTAWGFTAWAQMLTGQSAWMVSDAGISGNTTAQLAARYATDVVAHKPQLVEISIGSNDMVTAGSSTFATIAATAITNVQSFIAQNRAMGAITMLHVIMPRGGQGTASELNTYQVQCFNLINAGYLALRAWDVIIAGTTYESLVGVGNASHSLQLQYSSAPSGVPDYTHLNSQGAYITGVPLATQFSALIVSGDILFQGNAAAGNLNTNGQMSGAVSVGGGLGVLPTGYLNNSPTNGGATFVYDIPARTDGYGNDIRFTLSGTYTGTGQYIRVRYAITIAGATVGQCYEINGTLALEGTQIGVGAAGLQTVLDGKTVGASFKNGVPTDTGATGPYTETMRSLPILIVTTPPTTVSEDLVIFLQDTSTPSAPVSGSFRFGRLGYKQRPCPT